ncbi:unnamed protein product [Caenorhabditis bovis]|uniref:N-acetyltransferase domain-containing protein n=1 Tax=Caenorhabditis bovis TaxID=2654633 RepID=A0A8S1EP15_9PELO|nr:unnamed protein product [Caenorhabditis bovis]
MGEIVELRKRRITDFFNSAERHTETIKKKRFSFGDAVENLKCPKTKIFDDEKTPKAGRRSSKKILRENDKSQTILDCGQKQIGNIVCPECELVYCVDDMEDCKRHLAYHNRTSSIYPFMVKPGLMAIIEKCAHKTINNHRIVHIGNKSPTVLKLAVEQWLTFVDEAIGYCAVDHIWEEKKRIYVCLSREMPKNEAFVAGIAVIEKLTEAIEEHTRNVIKQDLNGDWIVGVDRIWTHTNLRRKGVARALLDAATAFDRAMEHRRRRLRIAFSDLTRDGQEFAKNYVKSSYPDGDQLYLYDI